MDGPSPESSPFLAALPGIPAARDPATLKRKSRDFYWYSPVLKAQLDGQIADYVLQPRDAADVLQIAASAYAANVPITPRGGGTGNYGQAVPLQGGAVVDMTGLDGIVWLRDGAVRVRTGMNMLALDRALRAEGWELRMYPSTKRTATIGGFIAGGSGGVGSIQWGWLHEHGHVIGAQIVTAEATPRLLELRGRETKAVIHAYGTSGLITELELAVQPAVRWTECIATFPDFRAAAAFGLALTHETGIEKKLCTVFDPRFTPFFRPFDGIVADGLASVIVMVAPAGLLALRELAADHGGRIVFEADTATAEDTAAGPPLYELTWNHTTLQVLKRDKAVTYLQCLYPVDAPLEAFDRMQALLARDVMAHLECVRFAGRATFSNLPVFTFTTAERLDAIVGLYESNGVGIANPHHYTLEDGSAHKATPGEQLALKRQADPRGLLNPGKMRSFVPG
jgi:FAD/FMN-containing dehydrogenase